MNEAGETSPHLPRPLANDSRLGSATDFCMQVNGGLDHAFHLVGDHFSDAARCLFLLEDETAAEAVREVLALLPKEVVAGGPDTRNLALAALAARDAERIDQLSVR